MTSPAVETPAPAPPRHSKRRTVRNVAISVLVLGVVYVGLTFAQVWYASHQDHHGPAAAIIVMGAAQYDGRPSPVFQTRLERAFELYDQGQAKFVITTGSKQEGDRFTEGFTGYRYLRDKGVPDESIVVVTTGSNTWEELSASKIELHNLVKNKTLPDDKDAYRVLIVSDGYHAFRLESTAREAGLDPLVASTHHGGSLHRLIRETAAVSVGRLIGYRRLASLVN